MPGTLYVKYTAADNGTRPIPPGAAFWVSPSIWLTDTAGNTIPEAVSGVENWIHVRVDSTSDNARANVKAQVWVCDYTAGFIGPDVALASSGGANGRRTTFPPPPVKLTQPGTAHVKWTPTDVDIINGPDPDHGHVCVGANVYVETPPPEGANLSSGKLDVINNGHHGWANITVRRANVGGLLPISFRLANPGMKPAEFVVAAWELEGDEVMDPVVQEHLLATHFVDLVDGAAEPDPVPAGCLTEPRERTWLAQGGQLVLHGTPETIPLRPASKRAPIELVAENGRDQKLGVPIRPGENVPVVLMIESTGEPGGVHTFDITQMTQDGLVIGGGRLVVVETPEWLC